MRADVLSRLVCARCRQWPLESEAFSGRADGEILDGVARCAACGAWYPIEDGLLELLDAPLAYAGDRARFWHAHRVRLEALGLRPPEASGGSTVEPQRQQQTHFDWYGQNAAQTYAAYERMTFWQAVDALTFEPWCREIPPGAWVLDFGCAQGRSAFKLIHLPVRIVGFDVSKVLVRQAIDRSRAGKQPAVTTFFAADATRFPFVDASFEYVLGYGVLHHLPDPPFVCREVARVLRQGGVYFGSENNRTMFRTAFDVLQRILPLWHEEAGAHPVVSDREIRGWLGQAGFEVETRTSVFLPPHLLNVLAVTSARELLEFTDRLCQRIPLVRRHGGLILVRAVRRPAGS